MNSIHLVAIVIAVLGSSDVDSDRDRCVFALSWGNCWVFEEQIKARLQAPKSYDFQAAKTSETKDGQIVVAWEFLASNQYGVKIRHIATGIVLDVSKCAKHQPNSVRLVTVSQVK